MSEVRALIVDDEPPARRGIRQLLAAHPDIRVVGECRDGMEALRALDRLKPDLLFLDIQMPELDGFGVIKAYGPEHMPVVIFVTAYDQFALKAFEAHALDYLVKPLNRTRFDETMTRVRKNLGLQDARKLALRLSALLAKGVAAKSYITRIAVPRNSGALMLPVEDIDWVEADDYFARIHAGRDSHMLRESLISLERRLDPVRFIRVHRSAVVQIDRVRELLTDSGGEMTLILAGGIKIPVSRRRRAQVRAALTTRGKIHTAP